ncbi:Uncharacterised protein r2_g1169 [Pycnogonum litorale]
MKSLARLSVWWPQIDEDINDCVATCIDCQTYAPSIPDEFVPWPAAEAWERVHVDYASFNSQDILVLVDAGSKWIEAEVMSSMTSTATLKKLYQWFTRFGFPKALHSDGAPQFTSDEFREKLADWNICHSISPPYNPKSNGLAERAVGIIKSSSERVPSQDLVKYCFATELLPYQTVKPHQSC